MRVQPPPDVLRLLSTATRGGNPAACVPYPHRSLRGPDLALCEPVTTENSRWGGRGPRRRERCDTSPDPPASRRRNTTKPRQRFVTT